MDEPISKEEIEYLQNFLYNFWDLCVVVKNLSPDIKNEADAFINKLDEFFESESSETKKINIKVLKNLMDGDVSIEIKHREPEKAIEPDISLIPSGAYCYDEEHTCPFRKALYYTDPLNSLIECKYLGEILKDDPCFGDEVKICGIKDEIE